MKKTVVIISAGVGLLFSYGLFFEKHELFSLKDDSSKQVSGLNLVEQATFDGIILKNGKLYDAFSSASSVNTPKDCKT